MVKILNNWTRWANSKHLDDCQGNQWNTNGHLSGCREI
jgi:hypothetical protein